MNAEEQPSFAHPERTSRWQLAPMLARRVRNDLLALPGLFRPARPRAVVHVARPADAGRLRGHVDALCTFDRHFDQVPELDRAAGYIETEFSRLGRRPEVQEYRVDGRAYRNLICSFGPGDALRIVVGAHYDVCGPGYLGADPGQRGADDNASGTAGILELARLLTEHAPALERRIDLVAFTLEEPPNKGGELSMGSAVYARSLRDHGVAVRAMLSLEMIGYFSDDPGSQRLPSGVGWLAKRWYPDAGNFIAVVGDLHGARLVREVRDAIRMHSPVPAYSFVAPGTLHIPYRSDNTNFSKYRMPACMVTDTASYRNRHYHKATDTPDTLDYGRMAAVVQGIYGYVVNEAVLGGAS